MSNPLEDEIRDSYAADVPIQYPTSTPEQQINFYRSEMEYHKRCEEGWRKIALRQQRELYVWHSLYGCPKASQNNDPRIGSEMDEPICDCGRVKGDSSPAEEYLNRSGSEVLYG